jgi:hypothetical protein
MLLRGSPEERFTVKECYKFITTDFYTSPDIDKFYEKWMVVKLKKEKSYNIAHDLKKDCIDEYYSFDNEDKIMRKFEEAFYFIEYDSEFLAEYANCLRYYFYPTKCLKVLKSIFERDTNNLSAHYVKVRIL